MGCEWTVSFVGCGLWAVGCGPMRDLSSSQPSSPPPRPFLPHLSCARFGHCQCGVDADVGEYAAGVGMVLMFDADVEEYAGVVCRLQATPAEPQCAGCAGEQATG